MLIKFFDSLVEEKSGRMTTKVQEKSVSKGIMVFKGGGIFTCPVYTCPVYMLILPWFTSCWEVRLSGEASLELYMCPGQSRDEIVEILGAPFRICMKF